MPSYRLVSSRNTAPKAVGVSRRSGRFRLFVVEFLPDSVASARDRISQAAGDPLPRRGPYTIYRGVSGRGSARYVKGISWTANLDRERWFASLFDYLGDPAVFRVTVDETDILGYYNGRNEEEFLVMLPPRARPKRLKMLKDGKCSV